MIAVANGLLSITPWCTWPPHRLDPKHAHKLERLIPEVAQHQDVCVIAAAPEPTNTVVDRNERPQRAKRPETVEPESTVSDGAVEAPVGYDAERLEKIAARAEVVFGPEVAAKIRHDGRGILRSGGGVKNLMAALLQAEGRAKPHPNPVAKECDVDLLLARLKQGGMLLG